jgi:hypothetical protein
VFNGLDIVKAYEHEYAYDLNLKQATAVHQKQLGEQLVVENAPFPDYCKELNQKNTRELEENSKKTPFFNKKTA